MNKKDFSPVERERATAFVKAFGNDKKPDLSPKKIPHPPAKPGSVLPQEPLPKPEPKAKIVDPSVLDEESIPPKVNIGAEYNARKVEEEEIKASKRPAGNPPRIFNHFLMIMMLVFFVGLAIYNFNSIKEIKKEQFRILENQRVIYDKLARIGKRLRR
ncbi:hypothetical protein ACFL5G_04000 [Candidatus Margulisiibacteriota bacterium]